MADGVDMCTHCPLCGTATDPADFHVKELLGGGSDGSGIQWTYECLGCGGIEKPTKEWVRMHNTKARLGKIALN